MPTSNWQNIGESIELIRKWKPASVLDVGCGFGRWGFLCREFLELWEGRTFKHEWKVRIDAIEGFAPYLSPVQHHLYDAVHVGNAQDVLPGLGHYDLIILGDVLEHFGREDALSFLATCRAHLTPHGHALVHIPLGEDWEQGDGPGGNVLERHLSAWTLDELKNLGAEHATVHQDYVGRDFAVVAYGRRETSAGGGDAADGPLAIAFATQEWPSPNRPAGGAGIYFHALARALAARGHRVHVVTSAHPERPLETVEDGVVVHRLGESGPNAKNPDDVARYSRAVSKRLHELDLVHSFDVVEIAEWAAEGWAFHPRRDQAFVVQIAAPSHFVRRFEYAEGTAAERRVDEMERWPIERADLVSAPSRLIADFAARSWSFDPGQASIIPYGVDATKFGTLARSALAGDPLVLCVNRLTPIKGPEIFVRAAAEVHRSLPKARFRMVGRVESWNGEPGDRRLRALAAHLGLPEDRLEIAGPVDHQGLPAEYAAADVCVNPSASESYSLTSAEALASGKACVLSDAMGIVESCHDGVDCLVARSGDAGSFAKKIGQLLGDDALREKMGAAARSLVTSQLSTEVTAEKREAAYRTAVAQAKKRAPLPKTRLVIAVLTHNALDWTKLCLDSLARHTKVPHHVFVLDNASTDGSRDWLSAVADSRVHVTLGEKNLGVPGGRNALMRQVLPYVRDDSVIVFLDNDVEVREGWYEPILAAFDANPRAGVVGEVGHAIAVRGDSRQLLAAPTRTPAVVDVVSGFCFVVRATCAREVGLFDEKLGLFWHEDDDWCVRATMHGWEVVTLCSKRVVHHEHKSGAALPGIASGGSVTNQKYLAAKWRALGLVDPVDGRIVRREDAATLALRTRLGAALGRGEPLPPAELDRAAHDLAALLMSGDVLTYVGRRNADLSPALRVMLDFQIHDARKEGNQPLLAALEEVRMIVDRCRLSTLLREHVAIPPSPRGPARGSKRLSKVCDATDWDAADWSAVCSATYGEVDSRNWYVRHRKLWESGQVTFALRTLIAHLASSQGIVVNAGTEPLTFGLANEARSITSVDAWGEAPEAPAAMLTNPERFASVAFKRNKLFVAKMDPQHLGFPDEGFDFAVVCSLQRFRTEEAAARVLAETARVVKPGGFVVAVTEVGLNAVARPGLFVPDQLSRIMASSGLDPIEDVDYSLTDATLDGFVDLAAGPEQRPHLVLAQDDLLFTSGVLVLERRAADAVATERGGL